MASSLLQQTDQVSITSASPTADVTSNKRISPAGDAFPFFNNLSQAAGVTT